jgi:alcohol dehydrogenase YqhD (iron-dependent ADH family)
MKDFEFYAPTRILFGRDAENRTGEAAADIGAKRAFLVYGGGSVERSGLLGRVEAALDAKGIAHARFGGVQPNPHLDYAEQGARLAADFKADLILAVGGGSAIDTAKGIAHAAANPDADLWEIWSLRTPLTRTIPVAAVLTIPAAGSEMSDSAVLTNTALGIKRGLSTPLNRPAFAIMNPSLCATLPRFQVACGVADILMHTLDRYFTHTKGNATTDFLAEGLLRTVMHYGYIAFGEPTDYDAMSELMWCSSLSHNGLTGLGAETDFAPHKLGHELSAMFNVAHGASLTAVWGSWARYVYKEEPERFARFAREVFGCTISDPIAAAEEGIERMILFFRSIAMPISLPGLSVGVISEEAIQKMADACTAEGPVAKFKPLYAKDVLAIYTMANDLVANPALINIKPAQRA